MKSTEAKTMTEAEWLACTNPEQVFQAYGEKFCSDRKLQLFCVRCCYLNPIPNQTEQYVRKLAAKWRVAERFADGKVTIPQLRRSWSGGGRGSSAGAGWPERALEWATAWIVPSRRTVSSTIPDGVLITFIRDVFGNPFRKVPLDPQWLTSTVVALAEGIYHDRAFDRMPILADALQDAGCDNEDVLEHCRNPADTHTRGCWLIDMLLKKS